MSDERSALSGALEGLLAGFGIRPASEQDRVAQLVADCLGQVGLSATVSELRHGKLVLHCAPADAPFVRTHSEKVLRTIDAALPGVVSAVSVRPVRG